MQTWMQTSGTNTPHACRLCVRAELLEHTPQSSSAMECRLQLTLPCFAGLWLLRPGHVSWLCCAGICCSPAVLRRHIASSSVLGGARAIISQHWLLQHGAVTVSCGGCERHPVVESSTRQQVDLEDEGDAIHAAQEWQTVVGVGDWLPWEARKQPAKGDGNIWLAAIVPGISSTHPRFCNDESGT